MGKIVYGGLVGACGGSYVAVRAWVVQQCQARGQEAFVGSGDQHGGV